MRSLYVHIPFCLRRCLYCDFYLEPLGTGPLAGRFDEVDQHDQSPFLDALEAEFNRLPPAFAPGTVYVGGGTPTELSARDFDRLLSLFAHRLDLGRVREWTCEANPGTLLPHRLAALRRAGVDRLSLGVQSFVPRNLEFLTRIHTADEAAEAVHAARAAGFGNLNLDLIFGVPGSAEADIDRDLEQVARLAPEHVSWYGLDFVHGTPLTDLRDRGLLRELDDEIAIAQYERLRRGLAELGYEHYELFNFARPGRRSRHNQHYWFAGEYYGLGPSAHSHLDGERFSNVRSLTRYVAALRAGRSAEAEREKLDPEAKARELLMTTLRHVPGVDTAWFEAQSGFSVEALGGETLARLEEEGWLVREPGCLRLHERSYLVANRVLSELI
jgi:oxygen-independent coproporphyrinogen-3 oxidase